MKKLLYNEENNKLQHESLYINEMASLDISTNIQRVSTAANDKSVKSRKRFRNRASNHMQQASIIFHLSNFGSSRNRKQVTRYISVPEITRRNMSKNKTKPRTKSCKEIPWQNDPYSTKYVVSEHHFKYTSHNLNIHNQTTIFKVYRCQMAPGVAAECQNCSCSCNSDVLFEVMKDLYDCYKKRDCDDCNCILCANLPDHEHVGMIKKLTPPIGLESVFGELAMKGFALPEGKTESEKNIIDKVRHNLGLPPEPKTEAMRNKYTNAANAGLLYPLENKSPSEKEKILKSLANMGIPLPEGRTSSEKALIAKIRAGTGTPLSTLLSSEKMRKAKSAGLLTPLEGKPPDKVEKILRGLAMQGILLPKGKSPSIKKLIHKVRGDLGLPPEPKTSDIRDKHKKAAKIGLLLPLEGKSSGHKEKILHGLHNMGIPLPVGRSPSEKALIAKIKADSKISTIISTDKIRTAKSSLRTSFYNKSLAQKEAFLKDLAMKGLPLPTGRTDSAKNLINKIRRDLGLPSEPKTPSMKGRHAKAGEAGILLPLEGKSQEEKEIILKGLADMRIPLPKGRTPSEKALISKVKQEAREPFISPEKLRKAKAAGLLTPLEGKTAEQKEKIFKGLAMNGVPLPEGKTKSEKSLLNKIRTELGLPPKPKTLSMKEKYARAADAGLLLPLEGKSIKDKEKILHGYIDNGIPLPEGRTPSEKALIAKFKPRVATECICNEPLVTSEKLHKTKEVTPLEGKSTKDKEKKLRNLAEAGLPLPVGKSPSEVLLIKQIKKDFGISEKSSEEKIRKAKAAGLLTPLEGKTPEQKETILRDRMKAGLPLPEGSTHSEKKLIKTIKASSEYVTPSPSERLRKAKAAGLLTPLKGKTPSRKEKILKDMLAAGVPLPEGTTPSEKEIVKKVLAHQSMQSKKIKAAKAAGLLTPLSDKVPEQKEKILKGLVKIGLPLPKPNTESERDLIDRIRTEVGLPPEPKSRLLRDKYDKAYEAGIITPLGSKSPEAKENILKMLQSAGIPLPIGRTRSEKALIKRVKAGISASPKTPFEEMTPEKKEKRLKHLIKSGRLLPVAKTSSGKALIEKVRKDMGLPLEPKSESMKLKMRKAHAAGLITPLEGKDDLQKNKILTRLAKAGLPLPEGRTPSEKSIIRKIKAKYRIPGSPPRLPSEILVKAKGLGLLTPLAGKSPEEKEKIFRGLAKEGLPLPETITPSEKLLAEKIRKELGLPPEPKTMSMKEKHDKAAVAGLLGPLEGLDETAKTKNLRALADMGIPLPEGRTISEQNLIDMINKETSPDAKMHAESTALLTPLTGKSHDEKETIIRGLAEAGLPLPKGETRSERYLIRKIKAEFAVPAHERTPSMQKDVIRKAKAKGLFTPLAGKKIAEKERIIRGLAEAGLPLPEGKTATERDLIKRVKADLKVSKLSDELQKIRSMCDRACGCDKKKIKFKHSYVKISILSPDLSNICPCPNDCLPGVKAGLYASNKNIKVVVERAIGAPQYSSQQTDTVSSYKEVKVSCPIFNTSKTKEIFNRNKNPANVHNHVYRHRSLGSSSSSSSLNCNAVDAAINHASISDKSFINSYLYDHTYYEHACPHYYSYLNRGTHNNNSSKIYDTSSFYTLVTDSYCLNSFNSTLFIKSDNSLSSNTSCECFNANSIILYDDDDVTSTITLYLNSSSDFDLSSNSLDNIGLQKNELEDALARSNNKLTVIDNTQENKLIYNRQKQNNDFQVFQMSERKRNLAIKTGEPVVVINHLNSEIDVTAVVDEILSKKEFCNASSLFVIVPVSDDEGDQTNCSVPIDPSTCFQLSNNYNKWNSTDEEELSMPHRRLSLKKSGVKVSTKGKKFFLEGVPTGTSNNKETTYNYCPYKRQEITDKNHYQMNSLITPAVRSHAASTDTTQDRPCCCGVGQTKSLHSLVSDKDEYIMDVVSEVFTVLNNQDMDSVNLIAPTNQTDYQTNTSVSVCTIPPCKSSRRYCHFADEIQDVRRPPASSERSQAPCERSQASCNRPSPSYDRPSAFCESPATACDIDPAPCDRRPPCQRLPIPRRVEFKKLLEQQSSDTIKELYKQIYADKVPNKKNVGSGRIRHVPIIMPPEFRSPIPIPAVYIPPAQLPPVQMPPGYLAPPPPASMKAKDEICPTCFKPQYKDGKVLKCDCSGKTKTIKMRSLCPCEQHQWPMSRILFGPKPDTRSLGCQCCICEEVEAMGPCGIRSLGQTAPMCLGPPVNIGIQSGPASIITPKGLFKLVGKSQPIKPQLIPMGYYGQPNLDREIAEIIIYGPFGGYVIMDPEGAYTQAGIRQLRYSAGTGTDFGNVGAESASHKKKNCECSKAGGKKKKKVICECPPSPEPEPEPEPIPEPQILAIRSSPWPDLDELSPEAQDLDYLEHYNNYLKDRIQKRRKEAHLLKSDLTQATSGFKFNKKKKPPSEPESGSASDNTDVSVEDAIRYYALTNPDMLREMLPPEIVTSYRTKENCACEEVKAVNTDCECPEEILTEEQKAEAARAAMTAAGAAAAAVLEALEPPPPPPEEEDTLPKGFKIRMPGKGSGSKGLSGICCFDMIQER